MCKVLMRLGKCAGVLALGGALALTADPAAAGEWEVRLPVQKTARITPQEPPAAPPAEGAAANAAPAPASAGKAAPKTALARAAEAAAVAAIPQKTTTVPAPEKAPAAKHLAPAPAQAEKGTPRPAAKEAAQATKPAPKPAAARKNAKAAHSLSADPDAVDAPVAVSAPAPKAAPGVDPKAAQLPPAKAGAPTPLALPADGKWVGDVAVAFEESAIVLHAATNGAVERITWFNLAEANGPRKLAVDLRGPWRKKGASVLRYETGPVKNVVVGEHEDRLRISLEFRAGAVAQELDPVLVRGENGFHLTIPLAVRLAP